MNSERETVVSMGGLDRCFAIVFGVEPWSCASCVIPKWGDAETTRETGTTHWLINTPTDSYTRANTHSPPASVTIMFMQGMSRGYAATRTRRHGQ